MVKIRLKRLGSKFNACYKLVVADAKAPRDGKYIEVVGEFNPHSKAFRVDEELVVKWIKNGAQLTQTVFNLFREHGLNKKFTEAINKEKQADKTADKPKAKKEITKKSSKIASKAKETTAKAKKDDAKKKVSTTKKTTTKSTKSKDSKEAKTSVKQTKTASSTAKKTTSKTTKKSTTKKEVK